jgi:hypothetical protein
MSPRMSASLLPNPFASSALGSAWGETGDDVAAIHEIPFTKILANLTQVRNGRKSSSIVITGEPGSGKTHLLGRLRTRLEQDEQQQGEVVYVYVRCNASATTLWRHLRSGLAGDLLKPAAQGVSRLDSLLRHHPERIEQVTNLALFRVLEHLRAGRHFHVASAWLRGEPLPDADFETLGIGVDHDEDDRNREEEAKRLVDALLAFIAPTLTVLCFDQVEGLATYPGERAGFHTLAQMISALHDGHDHLLMISCIVSAFEMIFDQLPSGADRDRWLQDKATLAPIDWDQALQLVRTRLDHAPDLAKYRAAHPGNPLWPLEAGSLKPLFAATGRCLPRTLIQACKQRFQELPGGQGPPRPSLPLPEFLQSEYQRQLEAARVVVKRQGADKTLSESLPWLLGNSGLTPLGPDVERSRYAPLGYRGPLGDTAFVLCHRGGNALTSRVDKIHRQWNPAKLRLKILRDPSVKPGPKGAELLAKLKASGAEEVFPLPEALAALQAIRNMIASANSGDLAHEGDTVSERQVTAWAFANLPPQLEKLRSELLDRHEPEDATLPKLSAVVGQRKIIDVEVAASELQLPPEEVSACARRHPMQFGVLEGPPMVLFEALEGLPPETPRA